MHHHQVDLEPSGLSSHQAFDLEPYSELNFNNVEDQPLHEGVFDTHSVLCWSDLWSTRLRFYCLGFMYLVTLSALSALIGAHERDLMPRRPPAEPLSRSLIVSELIVSELPTRPDATSSTRDPLSHQTPPEPTPRAHWSDLDSATLTLPDRWAEPPLELTRRFKLRHFKLMRVDAEIKAWLPDHWELIPMRDISVARFQHLERRDEYVIYRAGCLGPCATLEENIAQSLNAQARRDHRRGLDSRVIAWRVHHKTWLEYVTLYHTPEQSAWLVGVSLYADPKRVEALRCEYHAPVVFDADHIKRLRELWMTWRSRFLMQCRYIEIDAWRSRD